MRRLRIAVRLTFAGIALCPLGASAAVTLSSQGRHIPADAGLIDVTAAPYFAKGDGVTDNTAAIQQAIYDHVMRNSADWTNRDQALYFPNGTYLVSGTLSWRGPGGWAAYFSIYGQSESATIIQLKDGSSGFSDATHPKALIATASAFSSDAAWGSGNNAFRNHLSDLTLDVGNNPGAEGVSWVATNVAEMRNVLIKAAAGNGVYGVDGTHGLGPAMMKNVTIQGFQCGVYLSGSGGLTLEHIALNNQSGYGLCIDANQMAIRDLESTNAVPAIHLSNNSSFLSLIDSQLNGGAASASAILVTSPVNEPTGHYFLRHVTSTGYASLTSAGGYRLPGSTTTETTSLAPISVFTSPKSSLNLSIEETPDNEDPDATHWVNVLSYASSESTPGDIGQALQAAIDQSGATTLYLPHGVYATGTTVHVHGSVQSIVGFGVQIGPLNAQKNPIPVFVVDSNAASTVSLIGLTFENNWATDGSMVGNPVVYNLSPNTLVIRDCEMLSYANAPGAGPLFLEDVNYGAPSAATYAFTQETVWARQLNPECEIATSPYCSAASKVSNNGGTLWVLGAKTEGHHSPAFTTTAGGKTEILGACLLVDPDPAEEKNTPLFVNTDSAVSLVYATGAGKDWDKQVADTRQSQTKTQPALLNRYGVNTSMPLFVSYSSAVISGPAMSASPTSLTFNATTGVAPSTQTLTLANIGTASFSWSVAPVLPAWLMVSPTEGMLAAGAQQLINVSVAVANAGSGSYQSALPILSTTAQGSPALVQVILNGAGGGTALLTPGVRVYPNPWRADRGFQKFLMIDGLEPGTTAKIFTLSGREVKDISVGTQSWVKWNLTTEDGDVVASGLYLYLVKNTSGQTVKGILAVVR